MDRELLHRHLNCQTSEEEDRRIADWLEADPANRNVLDEMFLEREALALLAPEIDTYYARRQRRPLWHGIARWGAVAAAVAVLLFGGYYIGTITDYARRSGTTLFLETAAGEHASLTLPDGTKVWLNAATKIEYPALFARGERRVRVAGEARFAVTHDAHAPFVVETYACEVEVLGTEFNLVADPTQGVFRTALFAGRVAVTSRLDPRERVTLAPHEEVRLHDGHLAVGAIHNEDDYLWREGIVNLAGQTFPELMRRFEKAFGVRIILERTPEIHIGEGKIRTSWGVDKALDALQCFADFRYVHDLQSGTITIR